MADDLKLYEAEVLPDVDISSRGFYMLVLAVDILGATVHIERELDNVYGDGLGADFVTHGTATIREVKPPFKSGYLLCRISYPPEPPSIIPAIPNLP